MDIGILLREARERRGLSLDRLAQVTKIRVGTLEAIEADEIDRIPEVFLRGFVRAYAREVGLNPDDIVSRHLARVEGAVDALESPGTETIQPPPAYSSSPASEADPDEAEQRQVRRDLRTAIVMLAIGATAYYAVASWRSPSVSSGPPPAIATPELAPSSPESGSPTPAAENGPDAAVSGDVAPATTGNDVVRLQISARAPCWLSATIDGTLVVYQLMQPGAQHTFDVHDEAVLRVGDPAAIEWSLNGQRGRPLGGGGEAVTVHITPQNHREFVQRSASL